MSSPCKVHGWDHYTEPCPYCREINPDARHMRHHQTHRPGSSAPHQASNAARADRLSQAIVAAVSGDASRLRDLFTHDVVGTGPALSVMSRDELVIEIQTRDETLADVEVACAPLDVAGPQAAVEWVVSGVPAAPASRSGRRIRVRAITVAEFDGDQICSFRSYWEDAQVLEPERASDRS